MITTIYTVVYNKYNFFNVTLKTIEESIIFTLSQHSNS
ncbi:MAG: hypothetical protein ACI8RD_001495 [Bacillariaceae sp.]|jgi:hypothetical protein